MKTSYSVKDIIAVLATANVDSESITNFVLDIKTTMVGKDVAIPFITNTLSSYYEDELGSVVTPDVFVHAIKGIKPTFSSKDMIVNLRSFWDEVKDELKSNPLSFNLWKDIIISVHSEFKDKPNIGIKQLREFVYMTYIKSITELMTKKEQLLSFKSTQSCVYVAGEYVEGSFKDAINQLIRFDNEVTLYTSKANYFITYIGNRLDVKSSVKGDVYLELIEALILKAISVVNSSDYRFTDIIVQKAKELNISLEVN